MFKVEKNNSKIGKHLDDLIHQKYASRREFCRVYIQATGEEPTNETLNNMSNRLAQIVKGNKAIQTYDLPYFCELLGVSCEQILSAGKYSVPIINRVTNYSIACSKDPAEWEAYINREDKLILNSDEYCKTVLDYALEFGNYDFIKYLMDHNYIWFDIRKDQDYIQTFGAGTSIERRKIDFDWSLEGKLNREDALRINLITLAVDRGDLDMLNRLRARENPQLYFHAHYITGATVDFDSFYNERMVKYIASSSEEILDYFTDSFEIRGRVRYKNGSDHAHTFLFPYISQLLDLLIATNSPFAETALKKAIKHNEKTYKRLRERILSAQNDEWYSVEYMKDLWIADCENDFSFCDNGSMVVFRAIYSRPYGNRMSTNVPHVTKTPATPTLKHLAEELNESYLNIKNLKENIGDIV